MLRLLVFVFFTAIPSLRAQQYFTAKGQVLQEDGTNISVGDVLLLENGNETIIKYATVLEGMFIIEEIPEGTYLLKVLALGHEPYLEKLVVDENQTLLITLNLKATELEEVEIIAAKNPIEYKAGNLKVDVQNPYFSSIPNLIDLLSKLPGMQVSPDRESISILGKGNPLLYLGNQRISMDELIALPIDGIATIELLNNPSAKYEAEGRAVILITLKKASSVGFQGSIQQTFSLKRNYNNYLALNSNYSNKNWTIRGNLGYNQLQQWESNSFLFEIPEREVLVDYVVLIPKNRRVQLNPGFGLFYQWNDVDYISLNASARLQTDDAPFFTDTFIADSGFEEFIETNTQNDNSKNYYSASFNFNKGLTHGWNFFTGIQYSGFRQTLDTKIKNSTDNSDFNLEQTREQEYSINSLAFRSDLEKKLAKNMKWEWGGAISLARADALTDIEEVTVGENTQIDFSYEEILFAGYSSLSGELGKKTSFELGIRMEYNDVEGKQASENAPSIERSNTNVFPKANLSIPLDSTQTLNFNYSRTISRPDFSRASTITAFINPFLEGSGNVNLIPTLTTELSINYQKKAKSVFINYYQSKNPVNFTISYDDENDIAVLSQVNLERENGFYAGVNFPVTKGIWTSNNTLTLNYNKLQDSRASFSSAKPYLYAYSNHQLQLAKDTTLVLGVMALGQRQEGIFKRNGVAVFEASISKTLFKVWDCTLRFNDITRAFNFEERYAINGVIANGIYFGDVREVALSLKYRFGKNQDIKFKNRDVDDNIDRIN